MRCPSSDSAVFAGTALDERDGWYGKQLRAAAEVGLCADADVHAERYRLTWIPSFHPTVTVRVERDSGGGNLVAKMLDGAGGYQPGTVARDTIVMLSPAEWEELSRLVERAQLWSPPPTDNRMGVDGAQWIIEGSRSGQYNVVDRWTPAVNGPFAGHRALGEWLLRKSGLVPADLVGEY